MEDCAFRHVEVDQPRRPLEAWVPQGSKQIKHGEARTSNTGNHCVQARPADIPSTTNPAQHRVEAVGAAQGSATRTEARLQD